MNLLSIFRAHPPGLPVLFFVELWERFSYYGMRALLILYLTASLEDGGLAFDMGKAGAIYALYTSLVYLLGLPGGWLADRFLGQRRAVLYGGIVIAAGHFTLAIPSIGAFYLGLLLIVVGTGLLKPNISTIVGQLYPDNDARRDAGFSIFYMGINLGALGGPLLCSWLAERFDWHLGFGAAGVGMVIGLIFYLTKSDSLGNAGASPSSSSDPDVRSRDVQTLKIGVISLFVVGAILLTIQTAGWVEFGIEQIADSFGVILLGITIAFFAWLFFGIRWSPLERGRLLAISVLFLAATFFFAAYEQAGSSLNLFAQNSTERNLFGFSFPTGWFQSIPALYCVILAPVFAILWIRWGNRQPSSPAKFATGLVFVGLGFFVMMLGSSAAANGVKVSPMWLIATYLLHVVGEMCLSPVGLSTVTKLAPQRVAGLMMGVWFLAASVGNYIGGRVAGLYESLSLPSLFGIIASTTIVAGLLLALLIKPIRRMMGGIL